MKVIIHEKDYGLIISRPHKGAIYDFVKEAYANRSTSITIPDGDVGYYIDALCDGEAMSESGITDEMQETVENIYEALIDG